MLSTSPSIWTEGGTWHMHSRWASCCLLNVFFIMTSLAGNTVVSVSLCLGVACPLLRLTRSCSLIEPVLYLSKTIYTSSTIFTSSTRLIMLSHRVWTVPFWGQITWWISAIPSYITRFRVSVSGIYWARRCVSVDLVPDSISPYWSNKEKGTGLSSYMKTSLRLMHLFWPMTNIRE